MGIVKTGDNRLANAVKEPGVASFKCITVAVVPNSDYPPFGNGNHLRTGASLFHRQHIGIEQDKVGFFMHVRHDV